MPATTVLPNRQPAYPAHARQGFSVTGMAGIAVAHLGLLAFLASLDVVPLPAPLSALMVQIVAPTPPAPEITPPRPQPVERKPVVRPRPTPQPTPQPTPRSPVLAAQTTAPSAVAAAEIPLPVLREAPPPPAPPAPAALAQPRFDADYLQNPPPAYPALSRRMGEEGRVVLRAFVEPNGRPSSIEVRNGSGSPRLDQAALDAVTRWKFVAARRGDEAVGAWVLVPIAFNLRN